MKCTNCGFEHEQQFEYCTNCGAPAAVEPEKENPAALKVLSAIKDELFLVICILLTVSSAFLTFSGGFPVIEVLLTVFCWITYSQGRKDIADEKKIRCISGTVYAKYVVANVSAVTLMVCGVVMSLIFALMGNNTNIMDYVDIDLGPLNDFLIGLPTNVLSIIVSMIGLVLVFAGVIILVLNLLGMRKIHRFVKSVYQGIINYTPEFENPRAAKNWLIAFGIMSALSGAESSLIASGCSAATAIIASILINRYFVTVVQTDDTDYQQPEQQND